MSPEQPTPPSRGGSVDEPETSLDHFNTIRAGGVRNPGRDRVQLRPDHGGGRSLGQPGCGAVLIAGVAGVVSGAMSMGAGEYVSVQTQRELLEIGRVVEDEDNVNPVRATGANGLLFATGGLFPCCRSSC